jgi:hypothetical protein
MLNVIHKARLNPSFRNTDGIQPNKLRAKDIPTCKLPNERAGRTLADE